MTVDELMALLLKAEQPESLVSVEHEDGSISELKSIRLSESQVLLMLKPKGEDD